MNNSSIIAIGGGIAAAIIIAVVVTMSGVSDAPQVSENFVGETTETSVPVQTEKIKVLATFYPYYEFTRNVAGDSATVETYLPSGVDAHDWEPRPQEIQSLKNADVLVYNGLGMEPYVDNMIGSGEFDNVMFLKASEGIELIKPEGHAFEWAGVFDVTAGTYSWSFAKVDGDYADPAMKMIILESDDIESSEELAETLLESDNVESKNDGNTLVAKEVAYLLNFDDSKEMTIFSVNIAKDGKYAFFTEHMPFEFEADEHFFKDASKHDVEPIMQEPEVGHDDHHGEGDDSHAEEFAEEIEHVIEEFEHGHIDATKAQAEIEEILHEHEGDGHDHGNETIERIEAVLHEIEDGHMSAEEGFEEIHHIVLEIEGEEHDDHGHGAHAFEWAGVFDVTAGTYSWSFAKVDGDYADPAMKMIILESDDIESSEELAETLLESDNVESKNDGNTLVAKEVAYLLNFDDSKEMTIFSVNIAKDGKYAFFTEHMPFEFEADEHFFKDASKHDVEPIMQEPEVGHDDHGHGHHHHHDHGFEFDPHIWLDPVLVQQQVNNIRDGLIEADPQNKESYEQNAKAYNEKLDALDMKMKSALTSCNKDTFVPYHNAFTYMAERYGLEVMALGGLAPRAEASAAQIAEFVEFVKENDIKYIFSEELVDPRLAEVVAEEAGVEVMLFSPLEVLSPEEEGDPNVTYISKMEQNIDALKIALECQ